MERARFLGTAILIASVSLVGCAYVQPYVPLDPLSNPPSSTASTTPTPPPELGPMPNVEHAMRTLGAWQKNVEVKHNDLTTTTRVLNIATFGLAAGAVIAPVYNAYKDLITALSLGAGTTYTANTLFFPADQAGLYNAAQDAFTCVSNKGQRLLSAIAPDKSLEAFDEKFAKLALSVAACQTQPSFLQLQSTFVAARDSFGRALEADYGAGMQLLDAGRSIAIAVNREIDSRAASSAAIFAAAKSLSAFNVPASSATTPKAAAAAPAPAAICTDSDLVHIAAQTATYTTKKKNIDNALDAISQLDSACSLNPAAIPDLTLSQDAISLTPGSFVNVIVGGGRAPYIAIWEGVDPASNGIDVTVLPPDTMRIGASSKLTVAGIYTLTIRDSSVSGRTKKITVTAKLAK